MVPCTCSSLHGVFTARSRWLGLIFEVWSKTDLDFSPLSAVFWFCFEVFGFVLKEDTFNIHKDRELSISQCQIKLYFDFIIIITVFSGL